ncbi:hypothetical protein AB0L65_59455 [Nonomuraea sp. NPDC052116]|uniref:hypothetical protein n=1 Tax=Nonomuraea sp. NPDC052116 TaxID=3155665 RepID=UPI00342B4674
MIRTYTPLGVRFWDALTRAPIAGGLGVTAWPLGDGPPGVRAYLTPSGVYAFRGLRGMRRVEYPVGTAPPSDSAVFVIRVEDRSGVWLPATMLVPAPHTGPARMLLEQSPWDTFPTIYLFSAPSRPVPTGTASVRATLVEHATGEPAAHTRVDVAVGGTVWPGIAAGNGNVAVLFPFPVFQGAVPASFPAGGQGQPPMGQSWPVTVTVRYQPGALHRPAPGQVPTLAGILAQAPARIRPTRAGAPQARLDAELYFGRELVLATQGYSVLRIGT